MAVNAEIMRNIGWGVQPPNGRVQSCVRIICRPIMCITGTVPIALETWRSCCASNLGRRLGAGKLPTKRYRDESGRAEAGGCRV